MYLLLSPVEETPVSVLQHNSLFFKGLWQLELVSMKFEPLLHAYHAQASAHVAWQNQAVSNSYSAGSGAGSKTKLAQQAKLASADFDANCCLCALAGPNHLHHHQHGGAVGASASAAGGGAGKEPLLSLLFVTLPSACPTPINSTSSTSSTAAAAAAAPLSGLPLSSSSSAPVATAAASAVAAPLVPGSVPADSPLSWVNHRDLAMLRWLRSCGRCAQVLDVVDIDWSSGIVTAWANRTYVHYVRKCSAFAQVCLLDFEKLAVVAPPRSVVHLKTLRSVNIR